MSRWFQRRAVMSQKCERRSLPADQHDLSDTYGHPLTQVVLPFSTRKRRRFVPTESACHQRRAYAVEEGESVVFLEGWKFERWLLRSGEMLWAVPVHIANIAPKQSSVYNDPPLTSPFADVDTKCR